MVRGPVLRSFAQQRRHLAEAYYLVYLQDRMKKEEAEAERRRREDAAPDDDNEMIMRDPGALSYPGVDRAISSFSLLTPPPGETQGQAG